MSVQRALLPICILTSAVSGISDSFQTSSDELARKLRTRGFDVYRAFRPIREPNAASFAARHIPLRYFDYFSAEIVSVKGPAIYVAMPNEMSLLSALFGALSLIDKDTELRAPIILTPSAFWQGLLSWFKETALHEGKIDRQILDRIALLDTVEEIDSLILEFQDQVID
jgi:hypothetical protein